MLSIVMIGESPAFGDFLLLHIAFFLVQAEICAICFLLSAFLCSAGTGLGLGLAIAMYFLNLVANISESVRVLKYFTPFSFAEAAEILQTGRLEMKYLIPGMIVTAVCLAASFFVYQRKDLR